MWVKWCKSCCGSNHPIGCYNAYTIVLLRLPEFRKEAFGSTLHYSQHNRTLCASLPRTLWYAPGMDGYRYTDIQLRGHEDECTCEIVARTIRCQLVYVGYSKKFLPQVIRGPPQLWGTFRTHSVIMRHTLICSCVAKVSGFKIDGREIFYWTLFIFTYYHSASKRTKSAARANLSFVGT